ncbi:hypothetical protein DM02DRAFT_668926 [Periconia macrospinosa]|uniref:Uncharacterized protein n=1 Tax=Periconia macrospinosa TaxID=97972 RepID=A0A2V1E2E2_9PLEO|nr:hypothetical protein DM02DRAFT_668926 [Periconia macrospinosa]
MFGFLSSTLVDIATETEATAEKYVSGKRDLLDNNYYFRFNVQQGLQGVAIAEYQEQGLIEAATEEYLTQQEQKFRIRECVSNFKQKQNRAESSFSTILSASAASTMRLDVYWKDW